LSVFGLVIGAWGMFQRLAFGHLGMNYGSFVPWGLWVAFDLFFLGLTAGAFLITILTYVFRIKLLANLGPLAVFTVLVTLMAEFLIISLDLGHPLRTYRFLISPNIGSMLFWLVVFITAMWLIYVPWLYFLLREQLITWGNDATRTGHKVYRFLAFGKTDYTPEDRQQDNARHLSYISLPIGVIFQIRAVLAILNNRPLNSACPSSLLWRRLPQRPSHLPASSIAHEELIHPPLRGAPHFVSFVFLRPCSSLWAISPRSQVLDQPGPHRLRFLLVGLLDSPSGNRQRHSAFLPSCTRNSKMVAYACFLIMITFLAVRLNYLIPDMAVYKLEGLQSTFFHQRLRTEYVPNLNEWLVSIWVISLGLLAFLLGTRWLPVIQAGRGEEEHV
jgi:molybdopterin-containing oxidoreductase family membrane subunit